ncbi:MAG TPA: cupin domain-containing protein [Tahibacter sp.]|uniref:cupin domain-containing protein n=1 Tax=Tahibacter sp. TaxID=2056211 RepID=UPI002C7040D5|nr:cupin domain-containing protein [Tahibacter sp.]HSX58734.1 cupin domain-containing protein [Tahibacter sp.]
MLARAALRIVLAAFASAASAQQRIAPPLRIVIAGDSTASEYDAARWPRRGWGQELPGWFDASVEVRNRAQSGRSSRSFIEQGWLYDVARDLRRGDLLLIQFGHNDEKRDDPARYNEPQQAFPLWLRQYLELARRTGATPVLLTPVARRHFVSGRATDLHGPYAEAVRALSRRERVALVDLGMTSLRWLDGLGEDASRAFYLHVPEQNLRDNTHFHQRGAAAVACLVVQGLRAQGLVDAARLRRDTDCGIPDDTDTVRPGASRIARDGEYRRAQPSPHGGGGSTIAYPLFADVADLDIVLRRRVLPPGAGIGLHRHTHDEIYYVLSGRGRYVLDGVTHDVGPGDALLTRTGSSHALFQTGEADLVILINYRVIREKN